MKHKRIQTLLLLSVFLSSACLSACALKSPSSSTTDVQGSTADTLKLVFANVDTAEHPISKSIVRFSDEVKKESSGAVEIEYHFGGVLGDEEQTTEAVLSGEIDITRVNGGAIASWTPACGVFSIPFLFNDLDSFRAKFADSKVTEYFDAQFQKAGFKLLAFWYDGVRNVYTTNKFIETADDLKGLEMRTMTSPMILSAFKALGVKPTPINYSEVYTSLQQGVVKSAENNMNALYDSKHYEVAPYITGTGHLMFPAVVVMNLNKWNSLSDAQKNILTESMKNTIDFEFDIVHKQEQSALEKILADHGMYQDFPVEQKNILKKRLLPFYDTVAKELGREVVDLIVD